MTSESLQGKPVQYQLKLIDSNETYLVRHPVLREGRPLETSIFDGDDLETTIHIGLFIEEKLIGVCSFMKNPNNLFSDTIQYQLRGMAILKPYQRKGYGHAIIHFGETILKENNATIIWCNARKIASPFYKKNNYQIIGSTFNIEGIGLHYTMYKKLF